MPFSFFHLPSSPLPQGVIGIIANEERNKKRAEARKGLKRMNKSALFGISMDKAAKVESISPLLTCPTFLSPYDFLTTPPSQLHFPSPPASLVTHF